MSLLILGIDFGLKYIGLAIGETITKHARALTTITYKNQHQALAELHKIIITWKPNVIVLGDPGNIQGAAKIQAAVYKFAEILKKSYQLPIEFTPENLTTWQAKQNLKPKTLNKQTILTVNAEAARLVLQQWLDLT